MDDEPLRAESFIGDLFIPDSTGVIPVFDLQFKRRFFSPSAGLAFGEMGEDEEGSQMVVERLEYVQAQAHAISDAIPLQHKEQAVTLATQGVVLEQDLEGGDPPEAVEDLHEMSFMDYLPERFRPMHSEEDWAEIVLKKIPEVVKQGESGASDCLADNLQLQALTSLKRQQGRLYGAHFFTILKPDWAGSKSGPNKKLAELWPQQVFIDCAVY
jgi:hypothetical protein